MAAKGRKKSKLMQALMKRTILVFIALVCASAFPVVAQQEGAATTLDKKFREANHAYSESNFADAVEGYRELIRLTGPNAELYYNLGCASLKAGHLGQAVLNFRRAARLAPRDPDIRANLRFVTALTRSDSEELENSQGFITDLLNRWVFLLTAREVSFIQLVLLAWVAVGITILALGYRGALRRALVGFSIAGLLLLTVNSVMMGIHIYSLNYSKQAVVLEDGAQALSGPGEDNTRVLVLPEGTLVTLRETRGGWVMVSLPSGRSGWLPVEMVEKI
jgi:tetratricopeptide (TPR) repeat protein